ncbi:hypothetical protein Q7C36_015383 [Tachysurus vachellii]|uniref:Uncharacterized protein n=1 Tax=Tachysurus vachellii TaxID=175792 RepID=A0AA88MD53_TACVA|nr:hypothetical protein Q7C36_015383 [Tachysurus vachellii]
MLAHWRPLLNSTKSLSDPLSLPLQCLSTCAEGVIKDSLISSAGTWVLLQPLPCFGSLTCTPPPTLTSCLIGRM